MVRPDGLFQFATETYNEPDEECGGYWMNDYPPSGIFRVGTMPSQGCRQS